MNRFTWLNRSMLVGVVLMCLGTTCAFAELNEGEAAYQRGDYGLAWRELRPLAEEGNAPAQYLLGLMYAIGAGVAEDDKRANEWYRKSAAQGYSPAQNTLAVAYSQGRGVPQDVVLAYALYNLAAADYSLAATQRKIVAERMSPSQIAEGQKITRALARKGEFLNALDAAAAR